MAEKNIIRACSCGHRLKISLDGPSEFHCVKCKRELELNFYMDKGYVLEPKEEGV